ncbi:hypothetical protein OUW_16347 [Mycobacteroides abscessus M93]|nr:hypothetical protein OUW_16347 [Mycobacteroides abscessus M93]
MGLEGFAVLVDNEGVFVGAGYLGASGDEALPHPVVEPFPVGGHAFHRVAEFREAPVADHAVYDLRADMLVFEELAAGAAGLESAAVRIALCHSGSPFARSRRTSAWQGWSSGQ